MDFNKNRWNQFGTSIFTIMTQEAVKHGAINLAQGFPNFDGPSLIKNAAKLAIDNGQNQYAPSAGILALRQKLAARQFRKTGISFSPDTEVTVFSGATEAIFCSFLGLFSPGDEVICFEPYFDSYPPAALAAGTKLVPCRLHAPKWRWDLDQFKSLINKNTKAILLNTPHNPTGKVFTQNEIESVCRLAIENDLLVITDEVYEEIVFGDLPHIHIAAIPGMSERTITISSTSKSFSLTGWKIGYAFANATLSKILRNIHQFVVFCSATPLQHGMIAALDLDDDYYKIMVSAYTQRRDFLLNALTKCGFQCSNPDGSYFIVADYSNLSKDTDIEFCMALTKEVKVAAIPLSMFYQNQEHVRKTEHLIRFAFCKDMETLNQAATLLEQGLLNR